VTRLRRSLSCWVEVPALTGWAKLCRAAGAGSRRRCKGAEAERKAAGLAKVTRRALQVRVPVGGGKRLTAEGGPHNDEHTGWNAGVPSVEARREGVEILRVQMARAQDDNVRAACGLVKAKTNPHPAVTRLRRSGFLGFVFPALTGWAKLCRAAGAGSRGPGWPSTRRQGAGREMLQVRPAGSG
jgi:hypothetical protein